MVVSYKEDDRPAFTIHYSKIFRSVILQIIQVTVILPALKCITLEALTF